MSDEADDKVKVVIDGETKWGVDKDGKPVMLPDGSLPYEETQEAQPVRGIESNEDYPGDRERRTRLRCAE